MRRQVRPFALAGIAVAGVLASGILGGTTNAINGWISPTYFITILHWQGVEDVWRASMAQGIFEGLLFGVFFSLVFTVATGIITRASCSFGFAFTHLLGVLGGAYVCWAFGGAAGVGLAILSPDFYCRTFMGFPASSDQCAVMPGSAVQSGVPSWVGSYPLWWAWLFSGPIGPGNSPSREMLNPAKY